MKFNSQIATSRVQSERLLALGLKKETADMALVENWDWSAEDGKYFTGEYFERPIDYVEGLRDKWIPAWSLHRMMNLCFNSGATHVELFEDDDAYEILMYKIEMRIKEGYFNKEYLEE